MHQQGAETLLQISRTGSRTRGWAEEERWSVVLGRGSLVRSHAGDAAWLVLVLRVLVSRADVLSVERGVVAGGERRSEDRQAK
jgi:hypothetical protein